MRRGTSNGETLHQESDQRIDAHQHSHYSPSPGLTIAGWIKTSFIDFPATIATVLFFAGCNLRCPYCHNPSLVCDANLPHIPIDGILHFLDKRAGVIKGVVLSGGEPTLQANRIDPLLAEFRRRGLAIKLDTNGMLPEAIEAIAPDYCALDIKTLPDRYAGLLGAPYPDVAGRLDRSVALVKSFGDRGEIRLTVVPGFIDQEMAPQIGLLIKGIRKVFLQPMQQRVALLDRSMETRDPAPIEEIVRIRDILARFVDSCEIRGYDGPPFSKKPQMSSEVR